MLSVPAVCAAAAAALKATVVVLVAVSLNSFEPPGGDADVDDDGDSVIGSLFRVVIVLRILLEMHFV